MSSTHKGFFTAPLAETDPEMGDIVARELARQRDNIELIASENIVSRAVMEAQGSVITNKTVEGYPGARYHGGSAVVDDMERLGIARAKKLFGAGYVNLQPHSGSQANQVVYHALLQPGDRILAMDLAAGGHLSHGAAVNQTSRVYDVAHYGVRRQDGRIDMDQVAELARDHKPALLIAGGSAYPRVIDFAAMRAIADQAGALFMVDMAHIAGLVAGGSHPDPMPHAHVVTTTTTKTLRGARGGLILTDDAGLAKKIDSALFPGVQGSAHLQTMAGKTVCLGEALKPEFRVYAAAVVANARVLAEVLMARGWDVVSGGTDTHLILLDLRRRGLKGPKLTGKAACDALEAAGLTCNKNAVPFDVEKPWITSGLRIAASAGTTRGFGPDEFRAIADMIADVLDGMVQGDVASAQDNSRAGVAALCARFPIYEGL